MNRLICFILIACFCLLFAVGCGETGGTEKKYDNGMLKEGTIAEVKIIRHKNKRESERHFCNSVVVLEIIADSMRETHLSSVDSEDVSVTGVSYDIHIEDEDGTTKKIWYSSPYIRFDDGEYYQVDPVEVDALSTLLEELMQKAERVDLR